MRKGLLYSAALLLASSVTPAPAQWATSPGFTPMKEVPGRHTREVDTFIPDVKSAPATLPVAAASPSSGGLIHAETAPCGDWCFPCPEPCGPEGRFWVSAEYLLWWIKDSDLPPLVTASPAGSAGILGQPGTVVLSGDEEIDHEAFSGGRFTTGFWLNCERTLGVEASYFFLGSRSVSFTATGSDAPGSPSIARPFFNPITGAEDSQLVSFPGRLSGTVSASLESDLWGAELNGLCNLRCTCNSRLDFLAGFRFLELEESLRIREDLGVTPGLPLIGGTGFTVVDQFETRNRFYGGQVGVRGEFRRGRVILGLTGKLALGVTDEVVRIGGATAITPPGGATVVAPGGLLAVPTNSGRFDHTRFSFVPEVGVTVGYQLSDHLRVFAGYTFLYWTDVARPGDQIDRVVNPSQLPITTAQAPTFTGTPGLVGPGRPLPFFRDTDFWAQGVSVGLEFRY